MRSHRNGHNSSMDETLAFISPNGGGAFTWPTITGAITITPSILGVNLDSSTGGQSAPVATIAAGKKIGEQHTFVWYGWGNLNTPPLIQGAAGVLMMPFTGMVSSGFAGLVNSSTINTQGGVYNLEWNGTFWVSR